MSGRYRAKQQPVQVSEYNKRLVAIMPGVVQSIISLLEDGGKKIRAPTVLIGTIIEFEQEEMERTKMGEF